jgi:hypothetical protein
VGDIDFKVIFATENSNKFQKPKFLEGKISWGHDNTTAHATLVEFIKPSAHAKAWTPNVEVLGKSPMF